MKYTIKIIMLTTALLVLASSAALAAESNLIKVGLKYGSSAKASYTLSSDDGFLVGESDAGGFAEIEELDASGDITAALEGGKIVLKDSDGTVLYDDLGSYAVLPKDYDDGGTIGINGSEYRGGICFTISDNALNSINILDTEDYLYGVLNGEMHHGYPMEALKAQAVTARSFALTNFNRHSSYGFDVCSGTHCQMYKGYSDEYEETSAAVDETEGLALYYGGKSVSGYYFKNSGGHTQSSSDVWGGNAGYLIGVVDNYSPEYPWTAEFTFSELEAKLGSAGKSVGTLNRVVIAERNSAGAVSKIRFEGTSGTVEFTKESVRTFFGAGTVKSTMFSFGSAETAQVQGASVFALNSSGKSELSANVYAVGANGQTVSVASNGAYAIGSEGKIRLSSSQTSANAQAGQESVSGGRLIINGCGYGHGIGMPQDSAIEMAKQGFTFDSILKYYYTGIEIR